MPRLRRKVRMTAMPRLRRKVRMTASLLCIPVFRKGQESDWHRPPGAREPESTAVHSVIPISAVSHEMAGTQDPGLRTRDPGIVRYGCAGRFPGNPGLGRPLRAG